MTSVTRVRVPDISEGEPLRQVSAERIRALRRQGWTLQSLARQFAMPLGEVERITGECLRRAT